MAITKLLIHKGGNPVKARIHVLTKTGVAAATVSGTTKHSTLGINVGSKMFLINDRQRISLRNKLSEVRTLIIDEFYMVFSMFPY